jgi:hypothetical protein
MTTKLARLIELNTKLETIELRRYEDDSSAIGTAAAYGGAGLAGAGVLGGGLYMAGRGRLAQGVKDANKAGRAAGVKIAAKDIVGTGAQSVGTTTGLGAQRVGQWADKIGEAGNKGFKRGGGFWDSLGRGLRGFGKAAIHTKFSTRHKRLIELNGKLDEIAFRSLPWEKMGNAALKWGGIGAGGGALAGGIAGGLSDDPNSSALGGALSGAVTGGLLGAGGGAAFRGFGGGTNSLSKYGKQMAAKGRARRAAGKIPTAATPPPIPVATPAAAAPATTGLTPSAVTGAPTITGAADPARLAATRSSVQARWNAAAAPAAAPVAPSAPAQPWTPQLPSRPDMSFPLPQRLNRGTWMGQGPIRQPTQYRTFSARHRRLIQLNAKLDTIAFDDRPDAGYWARQMAATRAMRAGDEGVGLVLADPELIGQRMTKQLKGLVVGGGIGAGAGAAAGALAGARGRRGGAAGAGAVVGGVVGSLGGQMHGQMQADRQWLASKGITQTGPLDLDLELTKQAARKYLHKDHRGGGYK